MRERGVVEKLVGCKTSIALGVDAADLLTVEDDEVYLGVPTPVPSTFAVGVGFNVPVPTVKNILGYDSDEEEDDEEEEDEKKKDPNVDATEMVINAGIAGKIQQLKREALLTHPDGSRESRMLPLPYVIGSKELNLGIGLTRRFGDISAPGILATPASLLRYSGIAVNASVLPYHSLNLSWAKALVLIPGTKPFSLTLGAGFDRTPNQTLPTLDIQLAREIGTRKQLFCNWSSGTVPWPRPLQRFFAPFIDLHADVNTYLFIPNSESYFQAGILSQPKHKQIPSTDDDDDDDDDDEEFSSVRANQRKDNSAGESWQIAAIANPFTTNLTFRYSRNIFSGSSATDPIRSEWSSEGHYPRALPQPESRSVRLSIESTVDASLSLAWLVEATRQVGEFTRMGFGVGLQGTHGLVMTVSWSRLNQRIRLPVTICPFESVNADAALLAVVAPWLAYCALEFGFLRPRERSHRRRVLARRMKHLKKLLPKKRAESAQAIELMAEQVQRRQARELAQHGLVVTRAEYGYYPGKDQGEAEAADVTIPVAALVDHGQLVIPKNIPKFHILGFHDPSPLRIKALKIWYTYQGKQHYVQVGDNEGVACPMRLHLV
ncbi:hypothetical protein BO71DRAFT_404280 [Aspergillus ellipticus CBS 707.79]|uniref:DnaJ-like protein C11 C-terminal domain-containing protein n=1 Tax=Aspergillus ellipticus CBS 707.79 TaxID=1448320 RepID=A0A319E9X1_9EURO|nr:hypothetical protein BO71DRAFT_404280 [Aspergillus ellipticus CBS 707.79]